MSENPPPVLPADTLLDLLPVETQRLAARMAQDVFAGLFRQAATGATPDLAALAALAGHCRDWSRAGGGDAVPAARLALLISGLDQWGLAFTQAFELPAIHPLTALIGGLRTGLEAQEDQVFQRYVAQINAVESDAIEFKVDLRRGIHLALWHAMIACESMAQAEPIARTLGSLLLALDRQMPGCGWRLVADALAHIQISLLAKNAPESPLAREATQQLFAALCHALPEERYRIVMAHSAQAVVGWQQARRAASH